MHLNNILIKFYYENAWKVRWSRFCQYKLRLFLMPLCDKRGHNVFCLLENQHSSFMKQIFIILYVKIYLLQASRLWHSIVFLKERLCRWERLSSMAAHTNHEGRKWTSCFTTPDRRENNHTGISSLYRQSNSWAVTMLQAKRSLQTEENKISA